MNEINLADFDYDLPDDRIAQYPVPERDNSKLLIYKKDKISSDLFRNIHTYIQSDSLFIFNNTRVVRARLNFEKKSGAKIEVFCLEPLSPSDYELSFRSNEPVEWKCLIGNLKKWKSGRIILSFSFNSRKYYLYADNLSSEGDARRIRFSWNNKSMRFDDVLQAAGHIPLPPYIKRADNEEDNSRYQTIYSSINGSVAAPTAGLHFTDNIIRGLINKGIKSAEITLHVGAGTFQPVKRTDIMSHEMHSEHFFVSRETIEVLLNENGPVIAAGTTVVRTLESLFWLGVKVLNNSVKDKKDLVIGQWEPYKQDCKITVKDSLTALINLLTQNDWPVIEASTKIMIIPGYDFRMINGIITNFHQPGSTLLLLVAAWTGPRWRTIYRYAIDKEFRFLSYGDSSLLFR